MDDNASFFKNTQFLSAGSAMTKRVALRLVILSSIIVSGNSQTQADNSFREFADAEVATPVELFRALVQMQNLPPELLEQARKMSANLSRDQPPPDFGFRFDSFDKNGAGPSLNIPQPTPGGSGTGAASQNNPTGAGIANQGGTPNSRLPNAGAPPTGPSAIGKQPARSGSSTSQPQPQTQGKAGPDGNTGDSQGGAGSSKSGATSPKKEAPRSAPNEAFRNRMNRILLDAARRAGSDSDKSRSSIDRLLENAQKQVQKSIQKSNPDSRRRWQQRINRIGKKVKDRDSMDWLNSQPAATPQVRGGSSSRAWAWGLGLLALVALIAAAMFWRRPYSSARLKELRRHQHGKQVQWMIQSIQSRQELIAAFDQFVLWRHGAKASSWNNGRVLQALRDLHPESVSQIQHLVDSYTTARYAPKPHALGSEQIAISVTTLHQLAIKNQPSDSLASRQALVESVRSPLET